MTKAKPPQGPTPEDEKISNVLKLRHDFEAYNTRHTARAWIEAENELTAEEFDKYMTRWREGKR